MSAEHPLPLGAAALGVVDVAPRAALALGHTWLGGEHILLDVLAGRVVTAQRVRAAGISIFGALSAPPGWASVSTPRRGPER